MKKTINIITTSILLIGLVFGVNSCDIEDYLDKAPSGGLSDVQVFGNYQQALQFLAGIYAGMPDYWLPAGSETFTYATVSDEALCSVQFGGGPQIYTTGQITALDNLLDNWGTLYVSIRSANLFLEKIDLWTPASSIEAEAKNRMIGEAYFLRAFFYMELFKRYGAVPVFEKILNVTDNLNLPRNTVDETLNVIVTNCDRAASLLPSVNTSVNAGRATKGAALMLKANALLLRASKLHNPDNNKTYWLAAANAAKNVMDMTDVYELDDDYKKLFTNRTSKSIIFQSTVNKTTWRDLVFLPSLGGYARVQPIQELVDAYEMKDGSEFDWNNPVHAANPYNNRDPRLDYSIIHDGSTWKGTVIQTYEGAPGTNGTNIAGGVPQTQTGYYLAKCVDENASRIPAVTGSHYWVYMRYEEAFLVYAEAMNEYLDQPDQSVYNAINAIRTRAGINMPPLSGLTKDQMRKKVRNERRVEFAFEGKRFYDIRRWRIGDDSSEQNGGVMKIASGVKITYNSGMGTKTYQTRAIQNRIYDSKFDLFPIPQAEIQRQSALTQNPDY